MPLPEEVWIGEARHVSSLGEIRMELTRIKMCARCHQEKESLQCPLFNLPILPWQNGRVKKNDCFSETEVDFFA